MRMIPYLVQEWIDVRYFIAGNDNGYKYKLEQLAIELWVSERIHYLWFISWDDKLSMLQNADYVIFPSEKETFWLVTLEAMASWVIPIINHIWWFTGIVQHGKNGIVINFDDVKQYKEIIENAIDKNIMIATVQKYNRQEIAKQYFI